ncbi:MAG: mannose-1-phosphate guanylyltransferase/mannose-6-phosphate isomerase [Pseudomonadota bacterium]
MHISDILVQPVILCGGSGTRLWPLSRTGFPKQFLCLTGEHSLFQQTMQRLSKLHDDKCQLIAPTIVSNETHRFLVTEQLREIDVALYDLWLEPVGRNTAPALTLAAFSAIESGLDPVLVVAPADHVIAHADAFSQVMSQAVVEAAAGAVVVLGITPDRPETGYGYIQVSQATESCREARTVTSFVEKPVVDQAQRYLEAGNYWWNAGLFVLKASVWLEALNQFRPDIADATHAAWQSRTHETAFIRPGKAEFAVIPGESIDYAVMERCPDSQFPVIAMPLDAGWEDLGSWESVWRHSSKNPSGNAHQGDVCSYESRNTLVQATSRLVSLVGVQDLIVIETPDAVLVANKACHQSIKQLVSDLTQQNRTEPVLHRKVYRPWGWYDTLDAGNGFKVKRIQVKPKASLSLQMHHHRAEHWVVVSGIAEVTRDDQVFQLSTSQSTYIPCGTTHRLTNSGTDPLVIIEVQTGEYLSEEDIVRFDDAYGRAVC